MSISKIDADREAIELGMHEAHPEVTEERFEKYVAFAEAIRLWTKRTTEYKAAKEVMCLLDKVDK